MRWAVVFMSLPNPCIKPPRNGGCVSKNGMVTVTMAATIPASLCTDSTPRGLEIDIMLREQQLDRSGRHLV